MIHYIINITAATELILREIDFHLYILLYLLMSYYCCYIKIDHYIVDLHYSSYYLLWIHSLVQIF